jgi:hypothetical protein
MKHTFYDGSFMLSWAHARAWYNPDGSLKDCEYKRWHRGLPVARAIPAGDVHTRDYLIRQGAHEVTTAHHAADVEREKARVKAALEQTL